MWTVARGALFLGYTFWGLFPTQIDAMKYAQRVEGECFLVRIHLVIEEEEPKG